LQGEGHPDGRNGVPDLFIGGSWTGPIEPNTREIRCPADQSLVATVDEGSSLDTAAAIEAARAAFDDGTWAATTAAERGALLDRVADALERHRDEFAKAEALDTGKRIVEAEYDMDDVTSVFRYYAKLATEDDSRTINVDRSDVLSRVVH
jgi:betaine-aldehyde dehydrogenase